MLRDDIHLWKDRTLRTLIFWCMAFVLLISLAAPFVFENVFGMHPIDPQAEKTESEPAG